MNKKRLLNIFLIAALFVASFYYFLYGDEYLNLRAYHFDEAISAYGAVRILEGGIPYRDFWTFHFPGRFYALAAAFKIFGINLKVMRLFAIFILSLTSCGLYLFVSKIYSRSTALLAFLFSLAMMKLHMVYNRPAQFATLFIIFSWAPLLSYMSSGRHRWLIMMGVITGIIGIFRMDFACCNFIALFLLIFAKKINDTQKESCKKRLISAVKEEFYLLFGMCLLFLPNLLFFFLNAGFWEFKEYIISGIEQKNRYIPLPALKLNTVMFYFPALVFVITALKLLFYNSKDKGMIFWLKLYLLFIGIFLYLYTLSRVDIYHLIPAMILAITLIISLYDEFIKKIYSFRHLMRGISFFICFCFLFYSIRPYFRELRIISQQGDKIKLDVPRAAGFYDRSDFAQSQIAAIKYIWDKTNRNDKIFVGNLRHDKVVNNDVMFYFLSERHSATKYYQFEPGVITTREVQQKVVNDLIRENVQYIVLCSMFENINEPNESNKSSGNRIIDDFIKRNFGIEKDFQYYSVLKRKNNLVN